MNGPSAPSDLDRTAVWRQFDRRMHDAADFLSPEIAARMSERLALIKLDPARILDVGGGLGQSRSLLHERWPGAHYVGMDLAPRRVRQAAQRPRAPLAWLTGRPVASHLVADAHALPYSAQSFDLLWSNLVVHWLDDPWQALREWQRVMRPHGVLMFSAWGVDTLVELREAGVPLPAWPDMHDLGDALVRAGFADPVMETERLTLTWSSAQRLWQDLRALGGDARRARRRGCATPRQAGQAQAALWQRLCAKQGRDSPAVSVEIIYGHAWCLPRRAPDYAPIRWVARGR